VTKKKRSSQFATNAILNVLSLPVCASSDMPVVSPSSLPLALSLASTFHSSITPAPFSSQAPAAVSIPKTPPPRHRRRHTLTPLTKSAISASGSGSVLFTPSPRKLSDSPLFSPCVAASKKRGISPIKPLQVGSGATLKKRG
jgi:hypothetical protein